MLCSWCFISASWYLSNWGIAEESAMITKRAEPLNQNICFAGIMDAGWRGLKNQLGLRRKQHYWKLVFQAVVPWGSAHRSWVPDVAKVLSFVGRQTWKWKSQSGGASFEGIKGTSHGRSELPEEHWGEAREVNQGGPQNIVSESQTWNTDLFSQSVVLLWFDWDCALVLPSLSMKIFNLFWFFLRDHNWETEF